MKHVLFAGAFALLTSVAHAGGMDKPRYEPKIVPPTVVHEDAMKNGSDEWAGVLLTFITIILLGVGG